MKTLVTLGTLLLLAACDVNAVDSRVPREDLYACEGCEAALEVPPARLGPVADAAGPDEPGDRLVLSGTVYRTDGQTPAPGVVIYMHQTNATGEYAGGDPDTTWSRRHGRLRAWAKTGADGRYRFNTIKPAPYPDHAEPAHIHLTIAEPGRRPYFIDDVVFRGEALVTPEYLAERSNRGGSGVVDLVRDADGVWIARRDIRLEPHPR